MLLLCKKTILEKFYTTFKTLSEANPSNQDLIKTMIVDCLKEYDMPYHKELQKLDIQGVLKVLQDVIFSYQQNEVIYQYFEKDHFEERNLTDEQWQDVCDKVDNILFCGEDPLRLIVEEMIIDTQENNDENED